MDYKNKYNEALERARKEYKTHESFNGFRVMLLHIFPELEESEDERIRKWIIGVLSTYEHDKDLRNAAVAWLEKQGKQKQEWSEEDERISKTIIIGIENEMFSDEMREEYQRIPNINKDYHQIKIDWLKSIKQRLEG